MTLQRIALLILLLGGVLLPSLSAAQQIPAGTCTSDPTFNISTSTFLITEITNSISCLLYGSLSSGCTGVGVAEALFKSIAADTGMINTLSIAIALYIALYAIGFMLGMVQVTITDFLNRVVKLSIVGMLTTPVAWNWFYGTIGYFFKNGTDWLIGISTQIAVGVSADPSRPFLLIDAAINEAFSARMFVTLVATLFTGPYGLVMGLLLFLSLMTFVTAMMKALWVYLMSLVMRAFLFGLAPIFLPMLLFSRTQHLFFNWLNQLIYTMLAPTLLFTFFSFFLVLIRQAMQNILGLCVCYMPGTGLFRGSPMDEVWPRFCVNGAPYGGSWGWNGPAAFPGVPFPLDITNLIIFLILAQLAWRFNGIALNVAKEIASASMAMPMPQLSNPFAGLGSFGGGGGGGAAAAAAARGARRGAAAQGGPAASGNAGSGPGQGGIVSNIKEKINTLATTRHGNTPNDMA